MAWSTNDDGTKLFSVVALYAPWHQRLSDRGDQHRRRSELKTWKFIELHLVPTGLGRFAQDIGGVLGEEICVLTKFAKNLFEY